MTLIKQEEFLLNYETIVRLAKVVGMWGLCPGCNHRFCAHCEYFYECDDALRLLPEDFNISLFPPEMWDKTLQCCTCGSERHLIEWLRKDSYPVLYEHANPGTRKLNPLLKYKLLEQINYKPKGSN
jgi:hypothetical protein